MGGAAFFIALLLVVRPLAVWLATIGTDLAWRERAFLAWMAPRGIVAAAVSSLFALELTEHAAGSLDEATLQAAEQLVPITFVVIVGTVLVYGLTAAPLARWLQLADPHPQGILFAGADPVVRDIAKTLQDEGFAGAAGRHEPLADLSGPTRRVAYLFGQHPLGIPSARMQTSAASAACWR